MRDVSNRIAAVAALDAPARHSDTLAALFPVGVSAAEVRGAVDDGLLYLEERRCVAQAVPKRVQEFAAGRLCARLAMAQQGIANFALLAAPDRRPLWPDALVGSITHTDGFCGAVVGARNRFASLGLDTELANAVSEHLWPRICQPQELEALRSRASPERTAAAALIFAAKEAFYKCQYVLTAERLNFGDIAIEIEGWGHDSGHFELRSTSGLRLQQHDVQALGAFRFHEPFVSAGMTLLRAIVAQ